MSARSDAPSMTAIVCAYTDRRWDDLVACVGSLLRQTRPLDQVVVVIDNNDELLARSRVAFADCVVVPNDQLPGLSGARNTGIARATGDIVAFVDDDARTMENWSADLASWFDDSGVVAVGGAATPRWEPAAPPWFPGEFNWVVGCSWIGLPSTPETVRNVIGCNMAFRREAFERVGAFREGVGRVGTLPVGCEETELCIRMGQADLGRIVYDPRILVEHHVTPERATLRYFVRRCWFEGYSKAVISGSVGSEAATRNERHYVSRVLPRGVLRGVRDATRGDRRGFHRAAAISAGALVAAAGFTRGHFRRTSPADVDAEPMLRAAA